MTLSFAQIQQFKIDGYLVLPKLLTSSDVKTFRELTIEHLNKRLEPYELEADVKYPGGPTSSISEGGHTIRRLLQAYQRNEAYKTQAQRPEIVEAIRQILDSERILLNPNHHNCIMTKQAAYSSDTLWHRDTRYWNFNNKYLINAWFALGDEQEANGAMKILPGSHRWEVQEQALDQAQFLKLEHPDNQARLATQRLVPLQPGDVLLFSAHCFHAAGRNQTEHTKYSMVFTYHGEGTHPLKGSHSASRAEIQL